MPPLLLGYAHIVDSCGFVKACKLSKFNYHDGEAQLWAQGTWYACLDIRGTCGNNLDDSEE